MSSNELSLAIAGQNDLADIIKTNLGEGGLDLGWAELDRIPTPTGRAKSFQWSDSLGEERSEKSLTGVIVGTRAGGVLWPSSTPQTGVSPVLRSDDGVTARQFNDDLGEIDAAELDKYRLDGDTFDWKGLVFSSPYGRKGNRMCKEHTDVALLMSGDLFPVQLRITAGSNSRWQKFMRGLVGKGLRYYQVVTTFTIEEETSRGGQPYLALKPQAGDRLPEETVSVLVENYVRPLGG